MKDYYGEDFSYIHLKFGDARKMYFFTHEFRSKHPKFCEEYEKYWERDPECNFRNGLEIVNYAQHWNIPVEFYFNFTDKPAKTFEEAQEYFAREMMPLNYVQHVDGEWLGWDGEKEVKDNDVTNWKVYEAISNALKALGFEESTGGDSADGGLESNWTHESGYKVKATQYGVDVQVEPNVGMDVKSELASNLTAYIVNNFTNMPLEKETENGDVVYYDEAQDIFNSVLDIVDGELK